MNGTHQDICTIHHDTSGYVSNNNPPKLDNKTKPPSPHSPAPRPSPTAMAAYRHWSTVYPSVSTTALPAVTGASNGATPHLVSMRPSINVCSAPSAPPSRQLSRSLGLWQYPASLPSPSTFSRSFFASCLMSPSSINHPATCDVSSDLRATRYTSTARLRDLGVGMQVPPTAPLLLPSGRLHPSPPHLRDLRVGPTWNLAFPLAFPLATWTVWSAALATRWQWRRCW